MDTIWNRSNSPSSGGEGVECWGCWGAGSGGDVVEREDAGRRMVGSAGAAAAGAAVGAAAGTGAGAVTVARLRAAFLGTSTPPALAAEADGAAGAAKDEREVAACGLDAGASLRDDVGCCCCC